MSAKREKQIRRIARNQYDFAVYVWRRNKPSIWRIFRYLKWKKEKPDYQRIERELKT